MMWLISMNIWEHEIHAHRLLNEFHDFHEIAFSYKLDGIVLR